MSANDDDEAKHPQIRSLGPRPEHGMFDNASHLGPQPPNCYRLDPEEEIEDHPRYDPHEMLVGGNANARDKQFRDRYAIRPKILERSPYSHVASYRPIAQCERCQWQILEQDYRPGAITNRCQKCDGLMQLADGIYNWIDPKEE